MRKRVAPVIPRVRVCKSAKFVPGLGMGVVWSVHLGVDTLAEFDNHPDALAYAYKRAAVAQRERVHELDAKAHAARRAALKARDATHGIRVIAHTSERGSGGDMPRYLAKYGEAATQLTGRRN